MFVFYTLYQLLNQTFLVELRRLLLWMLGYELKVCNIGALVKYMNPNQLMNIRHDEINYISPWVMHVDALKLASSRYSNVAIHRCAPVDETRYMFHSFEFIYIMPHIQPRLNQSRLLTDIGYGSWIIYGAPNTGKSRMAHLVALKYNAHLMCIDRFNNLGFYIRTMYCDEPLVILLNEVDLDMNALVGTDTGKSTEVIARCTKDEEWLTKRKWNDLFDALEHFKYLIVIMTTNQMDLQEIYTTETRDNRITGILHLE